jgi:hypothetical protein
MVFSKHKVLVYFLSSGTVVYLYVIRHTQLADERFEVLYPAVQKWSPSFLLAVMLNIKSILVFTNE